MFCSAPFHSVQHRSVLKYFFFFFFSVLGITFQSAPESTKVLANDSFKVHTMIAVCVCMFC